MDTKTETTPQQPATPAVASKDCLGCPFCGEQPEYSPRAQGHAPEYWWPHTINHNCKVIGSQICIRSDYSICEDTKEAVTKVWNTRRESELVSIVKAALSDWKLGTLKDTACLIAIDMFVNPGKITATDVEAAKRMMAAAGHPNAEVTSRVRNPQRASDG